MGGIREWYCGQYFKPIIGKNVTISGDEPAFFDCEDQITIGDDVFMGHGVKILTGYHDYSKRGNERQTSVKHSPVTIEEGVWIASFAIILPGVNVGKHAVVGAGSVVTHNVIAGTLVAGNPARFIKTI